MPIPEISWGSIVAGLLSGGVLAKLIEAARERGKAIHGERMSLREFEERLRASVLHENADLHSRLMNLEGRVMELIENERKCDERNNELESEVGALRERNDELRRDLDAITSALDEQSKRIISDSTAERRANKESLRTLREGVAHTLSEQKARHGS